MTAMTGLATIGTYGAGYTIDQQIDSLLAAIPNPDAAHGIGAVAGGYSYLDEMSPGAAAQLRVELLAFEAANVVAYGQHIVTAGEDTANLIDIVTGLPDLTLANCAVTIRRAGTELLTSRTLSEPTAGTLRIADNAYNATAGDVVTWFAR